MTLLQRTSQVWKIYLFMALLLLGSALSLLQGFLYEALGKELAMQVGFGGVALIVGGFFWAWQDVTCPQCRLKLFSHAFRHHGFLRWFAWLLQTESCPKCGHGETPRSSAPRKKGKGLKRP